MAGYFDLGRNQPPAASPPVGGLEGTEDAAPAGGGPAPAGPTVAQQAFQYAGLVLGIIVQPWLSAFAGGGAALVDPHQLLVRVPVGLVMGLVLFPTVYRSAFDPTKPFLVQFGTVLVAGIGWQSAFSSVIGATTG